MPDTKSTRQMQELGVFVHGMLASLHALGIVYNAKRSNRAETVIHSGALAFSLWAMTKHIQHVKRLT